MDRVGEGKKKKTKKNLNNKATSNNDKETQRANCIVRVNTCQVLHYLFHETAGRPGDRRVAILIRETIFTRGAVYCAV